MEIIIALFIYLIPSMVAGFRKHNNRLAINIANVFVGWTVFGWIACLIWASTDNTESKAHQRLKPRE
jgi:hypothetical protein